ncbi:mannose-1-phosphate guanylyltransferase/mannose-6-phosphate isomerase [Desulfobaculum xiamenense]|uniref:mannose-1-phosphate guanylyltransferase n=1 Tax=Desulfobaculum xiamenense TaxID=995050 RepID=A0A846QTF2_9BACT|nr:mannose-1-phosphate guanylyltransferase/mannose-6-phosphate isomerase [Desulfobaculum xiamenense]NJB67919.1 mannose-1-phosphate guanylyltransferase/mannose-6-phosphate isomerase [Desulfobaculum xiamenense]
MSERAHAAGILEGCQAIVLAGGSGTRLWPYSRSLFPKQLLALTGEKTLLQETVDRALDVFDAADLWVVTNEEHVFEVRGQLRSMHPGLDAQVLAEPMRRNTLPAIMLGMERAVRRDPDAVVAVFPSDHTIHRPELWHGALERGVRLAREGWFVTFGVTPDKPETGYGYIHRGKALGDECYEVAAFVEKPDLATAQRYLDGGEHYWNSGMFVFSVKAFMEAVAAFQPELDAWWKARDERPLVDGYAGIPDISVDYGIMEKVGRQAVVRADFGWDDLGSWEALHRLGEKDADGNVVKGDVLQIDCSNSLLLSRGGKLAVVEVDGLIVVQTRDATLVCPADKVQRVKDVVSQLKAEGSPLVEAHVTVRRPWGSYTVLEDGPHYKIKRIEVLPGAKLSLQKHHHRSEHWVVISGTAQVLVNDREMLLYENQSVDIPKTAMHRLGNPGKVPVEIIEIQSGPYLEEDDIVRFDDVYGRIKEVNEPGKIDD